MDRPPAISGAIGDPRMVRQTAEHWRFAHILRAAGRPLHLPRVKQHTLCNTPMSSHVAQASRKRQAEAVHPKREAEVIFPIVPARRASPPTPCRLICRGPSHAGRLARGSNDRLGPKQNRGANPPKHLIVGHSARSRNNPSRPSSVTGLSTGRPLLVCGSCVTTP